jgi:putative transposase
MCWPAKTLRASWTGWCRRTRRSCGRISIRRGHPAPGAQRARSNDKILEPTGHAIGRSRGGLTTKVHVLADAGIRPVALLLSAGQAGDNPRLVPLLDALAQSGHRPAHLLADKAYSHPSTRRELRRRRIRHTIPERSDQVTRRKGKGPGGGRPPKFDAGLYKQRNTVERGFGRFKQWRGIATRYDKYARTYHGGVLLAATVILARP